MKFIYAPLIVAALVPLAVPAMAGDKDKERTERRASSTPYSNESQARKRLIRKAIEEATEEKSDHYRFRRPPPRRPNKDD